MLMVLLAALSAPGQEVGPATAADSPMQLSMRAEIERRVADGGKVRLELVPADRVVPGDLLIYTVEVRNVGATPLAQPVVTVPIPEHMTYVADSAIAPAAELTFSVDGGRSFDRAVNLSVHGAEGRARPARPADYTHVRWTLKNSLNANSVAYARFRAVLN